MIESAEISVGVDHLKVGVNVSVCVWWFISAVKCTNLDVAIPNY